MILAPLLGTALVIAVATEPLEAPNSAVDLSQRQKFAATQPLVRSATECIVHAVITNPHYGQKVELGDLIVDSMPTCAEPVHAMIDAYDEYFGDGKGEAFFMGPYLDVLPRAVMEKATAADGMPHEPQ